MAFYNRHPRVSITTECREWVAVIGEAPRKRQALYLSLDRKGRLLASKSRRHRPDYWRTAPDKGPLVGKIVWGGGNEEISSHGGWQGTC